MEEMIEWIEGYTGPLKDRHHCDWEMYADKNYEYGIKRDRRFYREYHPIVLGVSREIEKDIYIVYKIIDNEWETDPRYYYENYDLKEVAEANNLEEAKKIAERHYQTAFKSE